MRPPGDSSRQHALALTTRLATGRGFEPFVPGDKGEQGWTDCFTRSQFYFCDKVKGQEIQFLMWQYVRLSPEAQSFRRELMDSLRATFGASSVRECAWLSPTKGARQAARRSANRFTRGRGPNTSDLLAGGS